MLQQKYYNKLYNSGILFPVLLTHNFMYERGKLKLARLEYVRLECFLHILN